MAGFGAMFVGLGLARFGLTPLVPVLVAGGWVSSNAAGSVGAANLAGYIVGAALGVRGARRAGVRQIVRLGLVCATAGVLLSAAPWAPSGCWAGASWAALPAGC